MNRETVAYANTLLRRVRRMSIREWDTDKHGLIEEVKLRDDMPELFQEFTLQTVYEARCRVLLRRAFRLRFGVNADVANPATTTHKNYGRF